MPEAYGTLNQSSPDSRSWLAPFTTINAIIMAAISLYHSPWPESLSAKAYLVFGMFLHFAVISFVITLLVFLLSAWKGFRPHRSKFAIVVFAVAQILIISNVKVFSLYHFHLNGMVLNLVFSGALLENIAFSYSMWLSIAWIIVLVLIAQAIIVSISHRLTSPKRYSSLQCFGLFFAGYIALHLVSGCAEAFGWNQITAQNRFIPWMTQTTFRSTLKKMGFDIEAKKNNEFAATEKFDALAYPAHPLTCENKKPLNILMLVVDSLRADLLTSDIMPNTFALMDKALVFNNHFSTGNATRYGLFSVMYGLTPSYWKPILATEQGSALLDQTITHNYQHFIYGASTLTFPEFDRTIFSRVRNQLQQGQFNNSADNDRDISERLLADIRKRSADQPFFGFLFFDAPHAFHIPGNYARPFQPMLEKVNYLSLNNDSDPVPFLNLYKTTAHYDDSLIGGIINALEAEQLLENTLVIITSDHGQEFNETRKNFWGHNSNFSIWQTKVPLVMLWPGKAPASFDQLSSHEDVVPSLLTEVFGCTNPIEDYSTGYSLFNLPASKRGVMMESWTDRAIMYDNHLYLIDPLGGTDPVDLNYQPVDDIELPPNILAQNIERMSRFLKRR